MVRMQQRHAGPIATNGGKDVETLRDRGAIVWVVIVGIGIAVGLAAGGFLIGTGMRAFKADVRSVTVKGLVEREVVADEAVWTLAFRRAGDSLPEVHARISADRESVLAFLKARGFADAEIEARPTSTIDKLAQDFAGPAPKLRYVVANAVVVKSKRIDAIQSSFGATGELLKQGVVLDGATEGRANPHYVLTKFNDLRPRLLADATKNARAIATQFAADSGAIVGVIRTANQGNIQIFGADGNDESGPWSPTSTPAKKIRVVSTFEFELK
jgi:hypothetical protein